MRVLLCHNSYRFRGGEDHVFEDEKWMLENGGHEVATFQRCNSVLEKTSYVKAAVDTVWNRQTYREMDDKIRRFRPDVVHFHNTFPVLSPSAYYAARRHDVPVVQTLHNYRIICPGSTMFRDGSPCMSCVGNAMPWRAIRHQCYRGLGPSVASATMLAAHRAMGTWRKTVNTYIALTDFSRNSFVAGGIPAGRIRVKPNFVRPDPGIGNGDGGYMVFVGRLVEEKGLRVLLEAWKSSTDLPLLKIIGEGPMQEAVTMAQNSGAPIASLGQLPHDEVQMQIAGATGLVFPSIWHETFGRSIIEAYSSGTPVIASDLPPMNQLVHDQETGLLFAPDDPCSLANCVRRLQEDEELRLQLRRAARAEFVEKYTAKRNLELLLAIYEGAAA